MSASVAPTQTKFDQSISAFITRLDAALPKVPVDAKEALPAYCRKYKARTVSRACGAKKMHAGLLKRLATRLERATIYSEPSVADRAVCANDWIRFARVPIRKSKWLPRSERALEALMVDGIGRTDGLRDLRLIQRQYRLGNGRVVDLLCEEVRRNRKGALVAIELKRSQDEGVVRQVVSYLRELKRNPIALGRDVRAMIVTGLDDPVGCKLVEDLSDVQIGWFQYRLSVKPLTSSGKIGT